MRSIRSAFSGISKSLKTRKDGKLSRTRAFIVATQDEIQRIAILVNDVLVKVKTLAKFFQYLLAEAAKQGILLTTLLGTGITKNLASAEVQKLKRLVINSNKGYENEQYFLDMIGYVTGKTTPTSLIQFNSIRSSIAKRNREINPPKRVILSGITFEQLGIAQAEYIVSKRILYTVAHELDSLKLGRIRVDYRLVGIISTSGHIDLNANSEVVRVPRKKVVINHNIRGTHQKLFFTASVYRGFRDNDPEQGGGIAVLKSVLPQTIS